MVVRGCTSGRAEADQQSGFEALAHNICMLHKPLDGSHKPQLLQPFTISTRRGGGGGRNLNGQTPKSSTIMYH